MSEASSSEINHKKVIKKIIDDFWWENEKFWDEKEWGEEFEVEMFSV